MVLKLFVHIIPLVYDTYAYAYYMYDILFRSTTDREVCNLVKGVRIILLFTISYY